MSEQQDDQKIYVSLPEEYSDLISIELDDVMYYNSGYIDTDNH